MVLPIPLKSLTLLALLLSIDLPKIYLYILSNDSLMLRASMSGMVHTRVEVHEMDSEMSRLVE